MHRFAAAGDFKCWVIATKTNTYIGSGILLESLG